MPGVSTKDIARATGLSQRWIEYIRDGKIGNPGIRNIQILKSHFEAAIAADKAGGRCAA